MERPIDCKAGYKHHLTKDYLKHLQQSLMNICMRENLNQVDLLSPSVNKITQQEYYAKQRGQINLDKLNAELVAEGFTPMRTKFQTERINCGMPLLRRQSEQNHLKNSADSFKPNPVFLSKITVGDSAIFCRTERNTFLPEHWEPVLTAIIF